MAERFSKSPGWAETVQWDGTRACSKFTGEY